MLTSRFGKIPKTPNKRKKVQCLFETSFGVVVIYFLFLSNVCQRDLRFQLFAMSRRQNSTNSKNSNFFEKTSESEELTSNTMWAILLQPGLTICEIKLQKQKKYKYRLSIQLQIHYSENTACEDHYKWMFISG